MDYRPDWKQAVAGCIAGISTVLVLHPLDVIKTRLQVQDGIAGALPAYTGTRHAVRSIIREEGWRALYSGLSPALLGAGLSWGLYFCAYDNAKKRWQRQRKQAQLSAPLHLLSAAEAGAVVCCITNPIWVVKTRLQLQRGRPGGLMAAKLASGPWGTGAYRGLVHAVKQIARQEGIKGFYKGLLPSLLLVSHGAIQFMVYEELKSLANRTSKEKAQQEAESKPGSVQLKVQPLTSFQISMMGAASKLTASIATYPSQVVRSRLQQRMDVSRPLRYDGVVDVVRKTFQREGPGGFYKGIIPNVLRVMPQSAITFLVYERVMQALKGLETLAPE